MKLKKILLCSTLLTSSTFTVGSIITVSTSCTYTIPHKYIKSDFVDEIKSLSLNNQNDTPEKLRKSLQDFIDKFNNKNICENIEIDFLKNPKDLWINDFAKINKIIFTIKDKTLDFVIDKTISDFVKFDKSKKGLIFDFSKNQISTKIHGHLITINLSDPKLLKNNVLTIPNYAGSIEGTAPKGITKLVFADGCDVEEIPKLSFANCKDLNEVVFNNDSKLTIIGANAFDGTKSLKSINLPKSLKIINKCAFMGSGLINVNVPEGVESIMECAFYNCNSLENITLPKTLKKLDDWAISDCINIKNIEINGNTSKFSSKAFLSFFTNLLEINITFKNQKMKQVSNFFIGLWREQIGGGPLTKYIFKCDDGVLKENVVDLSDKKLINKEGLLTIPANATILTGFAPKETTKIIFEDNCLIGYTSSYQFSQLPNLKVVDFGKNSHLKGLSVGTFCNCTSLESVILPKELDTIWNWAFSNCYKLSSIIFTSNNNINIYNDTFENDNMLKNITFEFAQNVSITNRAFANSAIEQTYTFQNVTGLKIDANAFANLNKKITKHVKIKFINSNKSECLNLFKSLSRLIDDGKIRYTFECKDGILQD